jgi:23S rRNA (guanosine2251-2'-O)-methyltransferase
VQKETDSFVIYGRQPVIEALKSNYKIEQIWLAKDVQGKVIAQIKKLAEIKNTYIQTVDKNRIQKLSGPVVHQGIAAIMEPLNTGSENELKTFLKNRKNPFVIVLDQIQDPHNLGAILRTAEICGVDAIILPEKGSAQLNETVVKTSVGALFHLNLFIVEQLERCFEIFNEFEIKSLALLPGAAKVMYQEDLRKSLALVVGSEGQGVRKNIARLCSDRISIPQFGNVNSLNASVASAVIIYEVIRQRKFD